MAQFSITAVRTERAAGATHEHIARVKLLGHATDYARSQIIAGIKQGDM